MKWDKSVLHLNNGRPVPLDIPHIPSLKCIKLNLGSKSIPHQCLRGAIGKFHLLYAMSDSPFELTLHMELLRVIQFEMVVMIVWYKNIFQFVLIFAHNQIKSYRACRHLCKSEQYNLSSGRVKWLDKQESNHNMWNWNMILIYPY